jgi:uncharacterized Tic20 family protein
MLGWVGPLIALLTKGNTSPTVKAHARAALNFFVPLSAVSLVLFLVDTCGGFFLPGIIRIVLIPLFSLAHFAAVILGIVFGVIGGIKANDGTLYKYPVSFPIVK